MQAIPEGLLSAVADRYGVVAGSAEALGGGSASKVWRLDSVPPVVVRVSQYYQLKDLQRSCRVADEFSRTIPEAIRPLVGTDGEPAFLWDGQPVTVWPFVDGLPLDRQDLTQLRQAARLLGRLHKAALECSGLGDGQAPDRDDSEAARLLPDAELDEWLRSWHDNQAAEEQIGWMHRDFFPGNILCRQGEIVGLVDWDEVEWGPLIAELAIAVWQFGKSPPGDTLLLDRALEFLTAYRQAGGPVQPSNSLIPLMRERLRRDIAFWRRVKAADPVEDEAKVSAFVSLRRVLLSL
ncbi:phosphotransferase enzyme family protein [Tenggerimyces flavus]|uniref:Phosphotransferase enzyme family protein n=1 Tax=Tenggerimyces flavus TaxID=1708749 RepID=A0ABV7YJL0_9ACTN|nr:phosphotransferase [Tenggerimyces flavus]MBM7784907.1 Ser/Thr protein kinase RdoA (MazF antagonist) [Tenggerimyces flavus]